MLILYKLLVRERKLAKKVVILNKKANCKNFQQGLTDKIFFKKKWRMRILGARIFSKFFGGKIKNFDMGYFKSKFRQPRQW